MVLRRLLKRGTARRAGIIAVAFAFFLQAFAVASRPVMPICEDGEQVILCTGNGLKVVSLSDLDVDLEDRQAYAGMAYSACMCAFCLVAHNVAMAPSMVYVPAVDLDVHAPQAPPPERLVAEGFRYVPQVRAPPFNV